MLKYNDGVEIDTSGELRLLRLADGYYVIGQGMCIPVRDRLEGWEILKELKKA